MNGRADGVSSASSHQFSALICRGLVVNLLMLRLGIVIFLEMDLIACDYFLDYTNAMNY